MDMSELKALELAARSLVRPGNGAGHPDGSAGGRGRPKKASSESEEAFFGLPSKNDRATDTQAAEVDREHVRPIQTNISLTRTNAAAESNG